MKFSSKHSLKKISNEKKKNISKNIKKISKFNIDY